MDPPISTPKVDRQILRREIRREYVEVAARPEQGFHFHTGKPLAKILGYDTQLVEALPECAVASFAGTGNPFSVDQVNPGERVVDIGSGAGFDSLIAAGKVGPSGQVVGVDMTPEMLAKARQGAAEAGLEQVEFRQGYAEELPVPDAWADVVISNGVINLCPDKLGTFEELNRVLKPGGRLQIGDILVEKAVSEEAKEDIDLWTG